MAVSLATRMTPYMGSGVPKVVITGRFLLGCCAYAPRMRMYVAPYLDMRGLAVAYGSTEASGYTDGDSFSLSVSGRADGLPVYSASSCRYLGYGIADRYSQAGAGAAPSDLGVYGTGNSSVDYPFVVRVFTAGTTPNATYSAHDSSSLDAAWDSLEELYSASGLGDVNAFQTVTVVLTGRLGLLDLDALHAVSLFRDLSGLDDSDMDDYRFFMGRTQTVSEGWYQRSGAWPRSNGWIPRHVDIYDQPQLRGHVSGGGGLVTWR